MPQQFVRRVTGVRIAPAGYHEPVAVRRERLANRRHARRRPLPRRTECADAGMERDVRHARTNQCTSGCPRIVRNRDGGACIACSRAEQTDDIEPVRPFRLRAEAVIAHRVGEEIAPSVIKPGADRRAGGEGEGAIFDGAPGGRQVMEEDHGVVLPLAQFATEPGEVLHRVRAGNAARRVVRFLREGQDFADRRLAFEHGPRAGGDECVNLGIRQQIAERTERGQRADGIADVG